MVFHCLRYLPLVSIDHPSVSNGSLYNAEYLNSGIKEELKYASGMVRKKKEKYGMHNCYSTLRELQQ